MFCQRNFKQPISNLLMHQNCQSEILCNNLNMKFQAYGCLSLYHHQRFLLVNLGTQKDEKRNQTYVQNDNLNTHLCFQKKKRLVVFLVVNFNSLGFHICTYIKILSFHKISFILSFIIFINPFLFRYNFVKQLSSFFLKVNHFIFLQRLSITINYSPFKKPNNNISLPLSSFQFLSRQI